MKKIAIFASGSGTNTENIILHFKANIAARVTVVFCNNPEAKVLEKAQRHQIPVVLFSKAELQTDSILKKLNSFQPDLIVLAGFLLQFPVNIIHAYPNRIINIHPALLPKYGGKGMYGNYVHQAVFENNETETGISIHYVNEHYDEGKLIFQKNVPTSDCTTPEDIARKVHELEHDYFPKVIEKLILEQ